MQAFHRVISNLTLAGSLLVGCSGASNTNAPTQAGVLQGQVLDARNQPVANALIIVEPVSFRGTVFVHSNSKGEYTSPALNQAVAPYEASAFFEKDYHGRHYCLRMAGETATDEEVFNPAQGAVRNFRWRMTGPMPWGNGDVWGGTLNFDNESTSDELFVPWGSSIKLKLVPEGPLIDGSTGQVLEQTIVLQGSARWKDIPVGRYTVTARWMDGNSEAGIPLKLRTVGMEQEMNWSSTLLFDGFDTCGHTGSFKLTTLLLSR